MSSILTYQLRQQQQQQQNEQKQQTNTLDTKNTKKNGTSGLPSPPNSFCGDEASGNSAAAAAAGITITINDTVPLKVVEENLRRDSLPTVFKDMTLKDYSVSLPENYTIDHSRTSTPTSVNNNASHKKAVLATTAATATATAAATGGLTIRNRRPSENSMGRRKSSFTGIRVLSESFSGQYRCTDCGKSYKSPNCLQKHRWEHSEEWELTKKFPLTKHQQVQMLEAAAILVGMDRRESNKLENTKLNSLPIHTTTTSTTNTTNTSTTITPTNHNANNIHQDEVEDDESIHIDDSDVEAEDEDENISIVSNDSSGIFMEDL